MEVAMPAPVLPLLELPVRVLHFHDGAVHENADGDGDTGERHDVRGDAHQGHGYEREQHRHGNGDDGDDGGGEKNGKESLTLDSGPGFTLWLMEDALDNR